jgi:hypothetical protein
MLFRQGQKCFRVNTKCSSKLAILLLAASFTVLVSLRANAKVGEKSRVRERVFAGEQHQSLRGIRTPASENVFRRESNHKRTNSPARLHTNSAVNRVIEISNNAHSVKKNLWHEKTCERSEYDWGEEWEWARVRKPHVSVKHIMIHLALGNN